MNWYDHRLNNSTIKSMDTTVSSSLRDPDLIIEDRSRPPVTVGLEGAGVKIWVCKLF